MGTQRGRLGLPRLHVRGRRKTAPAALRIRPRPTMNAPESLAATTPALFAPRAPALLALADGTLFRGHAIGAPGHAVGEVVFNTAMTGYQEILTDPSYAGQIVTLTYPHIGN